MVSVHVSALGTAERNVPRVEPCTGRAARGPKKIYRSTGRAGPRNGRAGPRRADCYVIQGREGVVQSTEQTTSDHPLKYIYIHWKNHPSQKP